MKIAVIGAGAWGTSLACLLDQASHHVVLWGRSSRRLSEMAETRLAGRGLPGIRIPERIRVEPDLHRATDSAECLVIAVPSKAFREVTSSIGEFSRLVVSVTKGIEYDTGLTMCGVLGSTMPRCTRAALSGPSFAIEVARGIPTAIVAASVSGSVAETVQQVFSSPRFRVYTSTDCLGVELGGALKNVVAIAAGINDGLGFGDNAKAALVTRAIVEIRRLGVACGANGDTFTGLSGLGDLMATCFSRHSRNRAFGERVGRGESPELIALGADAVAEGYPTAKSARQLAAKHCVVTPLLDEVYAMLYEGKDISNAVAALLSRDAKPEL